MHVPDPVEMPVEQLQHVAAKSREVRGVKAEPHSLQARLAAEDFDLPRRSDTGTKVRVIDELNAGCRGHPLQSR